MTARTTQRAALVGLLGACMLAGCPAPEEKFQDFAGRYAASPFGQGTGGGGGGSFCPSEAPMGMERDGEYLFSFTPVVESPDKPAPFIATVSVSGDAMSLELQPLDADDRMTMVGDPQSFGPFPIESDGTVTIELVQAIVPPPTNPLTDSQLRVDALLEGAFCTDTDGLCGTFSADIFIGSGENPALMPLGTWTMVKIDGGVYPEPPPLNCAGDLAAPL